jgi:hypothetical protein
VLGNDRVLDRFFAFCRVDHIRHNRPAYALQRERLKRAPTHDVAHQDEGLVAENNFARLSDGLQAGGEVRFRANDRVVHTLLAAEVSDVAVPGIDAHASPERLLDALLAPFDVELGKPALHLERHADAGVRILDDTLRCQVTKEHQHCVADEFVHAAAVPDGNLRHFGQILV